MSSVTVNLIKPDVRDRQTERETDRERDRVIDICDMTVCQCAVAGFGGITQHQLRLLDWSDDILIGLT